MHGQHYFRKKECKHARLRLQGTRKIGCCAHIQTIKYTLYPDYQITKQEKEGLSPWKLRLLREGKLGELNELATGTPKKQTKYFVSLLLLLSKISELVSANNITDVHEVRSTTQTAWIQTTSP